MVTKTILIVDDEPSVLELLRAILESAGYQVIASPSGQSALSTLEKTLPDLVLLDMMMPGMSGREVCEKIRKNPKTKHLKIVFVTVARFSETGKGTLKSMKVLDYITKPFDNEDLLKRVKKALGKS